MKCGHSFKNGGDLIYVKDSIRPKPSLAEQYSMTVMHGNHPYYGPGSDGFRAVFFITALPSGNSTATPYQETQMTKEKLILNIMRSVTPILKKNGDIQSIAYLYGLFADAVIESKLNGSYDGTLIGEVGQTSDDFKSPPFLCIFTKLLGSIEEYNKNKCDKAMAEINLVKKCIETFVITKTFRK